MDAPRISGVLVVLALASGCVGTMDSLHAVRGEAPAARKCEVTVTEPNAARVSARENVSGAFSVSYIASGPFSPKVDVTAYCDGVKVKEMKGISPRTMGDTDLGKLAP